MPGRRRRKPSDLLSRAPKREPYDVVLIVCEGSKTEPFYLRDLRRYHRLSSANIEIAPSPAPDPRNVVEHAQSRIEEEEFDRAYCVFDRDEHAGYDEAMQRIAQLRNSGINIEAVVSWPCFEIWPLLHFKYTGQPYERVGRTSACERVIRDLKAFQPHYEKGRGGLYHELLSAYSTAMANARRLEQDNGKTGSSNPSTRLHNLVEYLVKLRDD